MARESLFFPPGKAANILRGGLGLVLQRLDGARIFEPVAEGERPSGLTDPPRPFVFRARELDGRTVAPGEHFGFNLNLFVLDHDAAALFERSFAELAAEGLGPGRGKAALCATVVQDPVSIDLATDESAISRMCVEFLTPTELKHEGRVVEHPEFPVLFGRVRDRIATLSRLYGAGKIDIDFQGSNHRVKQVKMIACDVRRVDAERRSSRTGQVHSIGGFVGSAEYEGDLREFLPYLNAARWTGVGRHAVWGNGEIVAS